MRQYNKAYRSKDQSTNVLSFPSDINEDGIIHLGDILLSFERISLEAAEGKKSFEDHLYHLIIHGTLHLLGYDHIKKSDANIMENLEILILSDLNIANPYL